MVALQGLDLDVRRGEFVTIVGPSGCGKSTLLSLVAGLLEATAGEIRIGGTRIAEPYTDLGFVFQSDLLLDWRTVTGNVLLPCVMRGLDEKAHVDRARELLASVGLEGFEDKRPFELSGGMRQRVALCRALLLDPPMLLMDEPFGALDALTREQMQVDLQTVWHRTQKTVLFVTHSISEAVFLSDRVIGDDAPARRHPRDPRRRPEAAARPQRPRHAPLYRDRPRDQADVPGNGRDQPMSGGIAGVSGRQARRWNDVDARNEAGHDGEVFKERQT